LTLSKLDARLLEVTPTDVDPVETAKHALRLYQQECQNADVETAIRIDQSYTSLAVDRVYVDPSRLLQVLINLLGKTRLNMLNKMFTKLCQAMRSSSLSFKTREGSLSLSVHLSKVRR
jgi:C4-dicarboxylate-specific signal transduction histidine kinase